MWSPYQIGPVLKMRSLQTPEGLGDRLRLVAFAERQAFHAFNEAAARLLDAPDGLREAWKWVALEESKHENWLLKRMEEIGQDVTALPVSLNLYHSLKSCSTAQEFSLFVSDAERRGQVGAMKFSEQLSLIDPKTAEIFAKIAEEETAHIALAKKYYPELMG